jgi:hypothetical protein
MTAPRISQCISLHRIGHFRPLWRRVPRAFHTPLRLNIPLPALLFSFFSQVVLNLITTLNNP